MPVQSVDRSSSTQAVQNSVSPQKTSPKVQDMRTDSSIKTLKSDASCYSWFVSILKKFGDAIIHFITLQWIPYFKKNKETVTGKPDTSKPEKEVKPEVKPEVKQPNTSSSANKQTQSNGSHAQVKPEEKKPEVKQPNTSASANKQTQGNSRHPESLERHTSHNVTSSVSSKLSSEPEVYQEEEKGPALPLDDWFSPSSSKSQTSSRNTEGDNYDLVAGFQEYCRQQRLSEQNSWSASGSSRFNPSAKLEMEDLDEKEKPIKEQIESLLEKAYVEYYRGRIRFNFEFTSGSKLEKKLQSLARTAGASDAFYEIYEGLLKSKEDKEAFGFSNHTRNRVFFNAVVHDFTWQIGRVIVGALHPDIYSNDLYQYRKENKETAVALVKFKDLCSQAPKERLKEEFERICKMEGAGNMILTHWKLTHPLELEADGEIMTRMRAEFNSELVQSFFKNSDF